MGETVESPTNCCREKPKDVKKHERVHRRHETAERGFDVHDFKPGLREEMSKAELGEAKEIVWLLMDKNYEGRDYEGLAAGFQDSGD